VAVSIRLSIARSVARSGRLIVRCSEDASSTTVVLTVIAGRSSWILLSPRARFAPSARNTNRDDRVYDRSCSLFRPLSLLVSLTGIILNCSRASPSSAGQAAR